MKIEHTTSLAIRAPFEILLTLIHFLIDTNCGIDMDLCLRGSQSISDK